MDDMMHDDSSNTEMGAEKHTYEVVEEFDLNGEPQMVGDHIELTADEAAPHMSMLELVSDSDEDDDDSDDDEDWDDEEEEEATDDDEEEM